MKENIIITLIGGLLVATLLLGVIQIRPGIYELATVSENYFVRMNKLEGNCDLLQIRNGRLDIIPSTHCEPSDMTEIVKNPYSILDRYKELPAITNRNITSEPIVFDIDAIYRGDNLLYRLSVEPYSAELSSIRSNKYNSITVQFNDLLGFKVSKEVISFSQMTRIMGSSNKVVGLSYESEFQLSKEYFEDIRAVSISWSISK